MIFKSRFEKSPKKFIALLCVVILLNAPWLYDALQKIVSNSYEDNRSITAGGPTGICTYYPPGRAMFDCEGGYKAEADVRRMADNGNTKMQTILGYYYAVSKKNYAEAANWLRKAADGGDIEAPIFLGQIYMEGGFGIEKVYGEASKWFRKAADCGNKNAFILLGQLHEKGDLNFPPNHEEAFFWLSLAEDMTFYRSIFSREIYNVAPHLADIATRLTDNQIAEVKKRVAERKPTSCPGWTSP